MSLGYAKSNVTKRSLIVSDVLRLAVHAMVTTRTFVLHLTRLHSLHLLRLISNPAMSLSVLTRQYRWLQH
jgi:hypothetical protein